MKKRDIELLYRSLDDDLNPGEQAELEQALSLSAEFRAEQERLLKIREGLSTQEHQFDPFFDARVMQRIASSSRSASMVNLIESLHLMFRRALLVGSVAGLLLLTLNFVDGGEISLRAAFGMSAQETVYVMQTPLESVME